MRVRARILVSTYEALPKAARAYLERIESLAGVPIDLISTGPDREETIVRRHPYDVTSSRP